MRMKTKKMRRKIKTVTKATLRMETWQIFTGLYILIGIVVQVTVSFRDKSDSRLPFLRMLSDFSLLTGLSWLIFVLFWPLWLLLIYIYRKE